MKRTEEVIKIENEVAVATINWVLEIIKNIKEVKESHLKGLIDELDSELVEKIREKGAFEVIVKEWMSQFIKENVLKGNIKLVTKR